MIMMPRPMMRLARAAAAVRIFSIFHIWILLYSRGRPRLTSRRTALTRERDATTNASTERTVAAGDTRSYAAPPGGLHTRRPLIRTSPRERAGAVLLRSPPKRDLHALQAHERPVS